jgi:hypothetical protein
LPGLKISENIESKSFLTDMPLLDRSSSDTAAYFLAVDSGLIKIPNLAVLQRKCRNSGETISQIWALRHTEERERGMD